MQKWNNIFPKNTGVSSYIWIIFCLLPFLFIFRLSSAKEIIFGIVMTLLFFLFFRLSFISNSRFIYVWISLEIAISLIMTLLFGYIYFALFLAFFIGKIHHKGGFLSLYIVHLSTTIIAITVVLFTKNESLFPQLPFIIITVIGVVLLPFTIRYRQKEQRLEGKLESANQRISQLMVLEERERIARDLHDVLGHKLSLIGLKSDLAGKLVHAKPETAANEIKDIRQTASTALNEVREMVSNMRGVKLEDEIIRVQQIIEAADMEFQLEGSTTLKNTPLLVENVLSMCLKESATNVVKHSQATWCRITIEQSQTEVTVRVEDNGKGISDQIDTYQSHGLQGMRERLDFVNGSMELLSTNGTTLNLRVPNVIQHTKQEESI